jgi:hypothetical protein
MEDRRLIVREVADEVGISRDSKNSILTEELWEARNCSCIMTTPQLIHHN